jgi:hypothetical protein
MLVAKRDPFHPTAQNHPDSTPFADPRAGIHAAHASRFSRAMGTLQMLGTLLAIPLGLASGYSMYRANFSVDTTCQSLRANIVSMLDKGVDARTRHILVRRDVETFEQTCGSVDPDATAAFKALLVADQAPVPAPVVKRVEAKPEAKPVEEKPKEIARKAEPKVEPKVEPKPVPPAPVVASVSGAAEATPAQTDVARISDSAWLAAVRGALKPTEASSPAEPADDVAKTASLPATEPTKPAAHETHSNQELRVSIPASAPGAAAKGPVQLSPPVADAPLVAQPLPPPATIASVPGPAQEGDHPVPPGSVPTPVLDAPEPQSRFGAIVGKIPFVGQIIEWRSR